MWNNSTSLRCVRVAPLLFAAISCRTTLGFETRDSAQPSCDDGTCVTESSKQARSLLQNQRESKQVASESIEVCKRWCAKNEQPWKVKCGFDKCTGCSECQADKPNIAKLDTKPCKSWCAKHSQPWDKKCSFDACAGCSACETVGATPLKQPHIIMFMMDDLGFNDFIESPDMSPLWVHTKKAASKGVHVNASYGECLCSPSRSTFMSGRPRHAIKDGFEWGSYSTTDEMSLARKLRDVGYKSYGLGKWHLGHGTTGIQPAGRGFARYFGMMENVDHFNYCYYGKGYSGEKNFDLLYQEGEPFESDTATADKPFSRHGIEHIGQYSTGVLNSYAVEFITKHKTRFPEKPFFLYYAMYAVHTPLEAPEEYMSRCSKSVFTNANRRALCAMIAAVDDAIGELVEVMSSVYKDEQYVMIVGTDNGGASWSPWLGSNNFPLRGNKVELWEGGTRANALVFGNHPDLESVAGTKYTGGYMAMRDWHATIAELGNYTGVMDPDALSMWKAITTNGPSPRTEMITGQTKGGKGLSFRMKTDGGDWKLYKDIQVGGKYAHVWPIKTEPDDYKFLRQQKKINGKEYVKEFALYNLEVDESESEDMAGKRPEIVQKMLSRIQEIAEETRYSTGYDNYPCEGKTCSESWKYPEVAACCQSKSKGRDETQKKAAELLEWGPAGNPCKKGGVSTNYWEL